MSDRNAASHRLIVLALSSIAVLLCPAARADIRLPAVIGDNMVLQAGDTVSIWGWADTGEEISVKVSWHKTEWTVQADNAGRWTFKMTAPDVGGPYEMTLKGKNTIAIKNILVGEVWVCSGQSNMQMSVRSSANADQEIAAANYPKIRLFSVERKVAETPQEDCKGQWVECSPQTVGDFSAAAYFFGRELHKQLNVPVGLIHTSWGGTPAEAWTSPSMLERNPVFEPIAKRYKDAVAVYPKAMEEFKQKLEQWKKDAEKAKADLTQVPPRPGEPFGPGNPNSPCGLYNAMIAPLTPYTICGAIWYQGESNAGRAYQYRELFPAMIKSWWEAWRQGQFPFLFVQLANFQAVKEEPGDSNWAELREAQLMALALPSAGMAVAIDIGDAVDIHPKNKQDVGKRLALWALAKTYGVKTPYSGPIYRDMETKGNKIVLRFDHTNGGLVTKDGAPLKGFAIAATDRKFVWADAKVEGDTVVVSSDKVAEPVAVRYAWADNPICNLYNKAGLPASPFRTDAWPGVTVDSK